MNRYSNASQTVNAAYRRLNRYDTDRIYSFELPSGGARPEGFVSIPAARVGARRVPPVQ